MKRVRDGIEKPAGWFWYLGEDVVNAKPRWGYLGSMDLRPTGHDFREWFVGLGRFVLTIGHCGEGVS